MRSMIGVPVTSILKIGMTMRMLARQMSAMVMLSPWQKAPVSASAARRASTARSPVVNQCVRQARSASASRPAVSVRYFATRGTISGWVSAVSMEAIARTLARPCGVRGRSGGTGCTSSRNSRIACDWVSGGASGESRSIIAGIAPSGLMARNASPRCSPASISTKRSS